MTIFSTFPEIIEEEQNEEETEMLLASVRKQGRRPALTGDPETLKMIRDRFYGTPISAKTISASFL
jgi:hypothetical protein